MNEEVVNALTDGLKCFQPATVSRIARINNGSKRKIDFSGAKQSPPEADMEWCFEWIV